MRILHTSDWHLGISLFRMSMLNEQENFLTVLEEIIKKNNIDAVVIAGDIFDTSIAGSEAVSLYNKIVTKICLELSKTTIIIAGNHDSAARISSCSELLKTAGLYIFGKISRPFKPLTLGNVCFYPIPYFSIDEVRFLYPESKIESYDSAFKIICNDIKKNIDKSKFNFAIAHAFIANSDVCESDKAAIIGNASMVSASCFDDFSYTALGHLHKFQNISKRIKYSGSPLKFSFSEANFDKKAIIIDSEKNTIETIKITPLHDMKIISGNYENIIKDAVFSEDYIKIELTNEVGSEFILEDLKKFYPNLLTVASDLYKSQNPSSSLTLTEIDEFSPDEIISKFFNEIYEEEPDQKQVDKFKKCLEIIMNKEV